MGLTPIENTPYLQDYQLGDQMPDLSQYHSAEFSFWRKTEEKRGMVEFFTFGHPRYSEPEFGAAYLRCPPKDGEKAHWDGLNGKKLPFAVINFETEELYIDNPTDGKIDNIRSVYGRKISDDAPDECNGG